MDEGAHNKSPLAMNLDGIQDLKPVMNDVLRIVTTFSLTI